MSLEGKNEELLTLNEVAVYLKLAEKTILRMVQKNEIPCFKIASQWRFRKDEIDLWIRGKMNKPSQSATSSLLESSPHKVPLSQLCNEDLVVLDVPGISKREILTSLAKPLLNADILDNLESYVDKLLMREDMITTALSKGIALPHVRNPQELRAPFPAIVAGRRPDGCDFNSLDGQPTKLFFLIYSDNVTVHLRITSRINRILMKEGLIQELLAAPTKEEFLKLLFTEDDAVRHLESGE